MGWCHEFGVTVREDCGHPVQAGRSACHCPVCGVVCEGQFAGCATVWANGPRTVNLVQPGERATRLGLGYRRLAITDVAVAVAEEATDVSEEGEAGSEDAVARVEESVAVIPGAVAIADVTGLRTAWPLVNGWAAANRAHAAAPQISAGWYKAPEDVRAAPDLEGEREQPQEVQEGPERPLGELEPTEPEAEVPVAEPGAEPAPLAVLAEEQAQVSEWLQDSLDGMRAQLRVLSDAVNRQRAIAAFTESGAAAERFSDLANALPGRIGEAVREAVVPRQDATSTQSPNGQAPRISTPAQERPAAEPEPAPEPEPAATPIAPATAQPASQGRPHNPPGVRTQLSTIASTIQSRVEHLGWQEKLRGLRPAADSRDAVSTR